MQAVFTCESCNRAYTAAELQDMGIELTEIGDGEYEYLCPYSGHKLQWTLWGNNDDY